jgi:hypothetical protein
VRADGQGGMTGNVQEGKVGGTVQFSETSKVWQEAGGMVLGNRWPDLFENVVKWKGLDGNLNG